MKQLHIHPDKKIFLRDHEGEVLFEGSIEEAEKVVGPLPALPEGVNEIQLDLETGAVAAFGKRGQVDDVEWLPAMAIKKLDKLKEAGDAKKAASILAEVAADSQAESTKLKAVEPEKKEMSAEDRTLLEEHRAALARLVEIAEGEPDKDSIKTLRQDLKAVAAFLVKCVR